MTLRLNGTSSGFTEIDAPAAAGSNKITLPTSNGSAEQFLKNSGTAGTLEYSSMVETSTGVGIGTSSPSAIAHFKGAGGAATGNELLRLETQQSTGGGWISFNDSSARKGYLGYKETSNDGIHIFNEENSFIALGTNSAERVRITSGGATYFLATSEPSASVGGAAVLSVSGGALMRVSRTGTGSQGVMDFFNSNGGVGSITTSGSSTAFNTSSDYRLKENVVDLDGAITRVKQLAPKRFNFIVDADTTVDGFLAHEAQTVVPEAVTGTHNQVDDNDNPVYQAIDQSKLVPLLTAALQEAIGKIETLETQNTSQQTQIDDLLARVTALEAA